MKIVYVSNFMNHHQLPVAQELYVKLGENYKFIALEDTPEERRSMGYADMNHAYPFVVCAYDSPQWKVYADELAFNCDILIAGSCPDYYIKRRTNAGKIVIKASERFFKKSDGWTDTVRHCLSAKRHLMPFQKKSLYFLCASAYTAADVNKYTDFRDRTYKWGYFPEVKRYDDIDHLIEWKHPASILWVARLIEWKHPELPVLIAKRLKAEGQRFDMNIIGNGTLEDSIREMIAANDLEDCVHMLGAMKPEEVRGHMERSEIFLFTSDRNEGWGAVLNEAMNSGCAVVASHAIGSVPYLVENGVNGFIYRDGDFDDLCEKVEWLLEHATERKAMAREAYRTMANEWNAENATARLLALFERLLASENTCFEEGVCSPAQPLGDDWFERRE